MARREMTWFIKQKFYCPCVVVQLVLACPLPSIGQSIPSIEIKVRKGGFGQTVLRHCVVSGKEGGWGIGIHFWYTVRALSSIHLPIPFHFFVPDSRVRHFSRVRRFHEVLM